MQQNCLVFIDWSQLEPKYKYWAADPCGGFHVYTEKPQWNEELECWNTNTAQDRFYIGQADFEGSATSWGPRPVSSLEEGTQFDEIQKAIALLKLHGYTIFKQT